jgi:very-short-patch-repair endonuclease
MTKVYNKITYKPKRRELRFNQTLAEKTLWLYLRKRQILNTRFLRQYSVDKYIVDFYSPEIKLGIELDGDSHIGTEEYDKYRQSYIEEYNIDIIRFTNEQVLTDMKKVISEITEIVIKHKQQTPPSLPFSQRGGKEGFGV